MKKAYILIIISGILYGTITPGGELLLNKGFSFIDVSFYRALFISVLIIPVLLLRPVYIFPAAMIPFFAIYGLIGGLLEAAMFASLYLGVPVALVVFFLYTQPVWTILTGRFFLGERIYKRHLLAVASGITGMLILVRSWEVKSTESTAGVIIALIAGFLLSLWVIWARKSAIHNNHYITTTFGWSLFAAIWLAVIAVIAGIFLPNTGDKLAVNPSLITSNIRDIVLFAVVAGLLPHLLFYRGIRDVNASAAGFILLLEPVSATVIAALVFGDKIGLSFITGAFLILLSNIFVIRGQS